jgi:hypothetical protein
MGSDFKFILEMWRDSEFHVIQDTNHKWDQMNEVLSNLEDKFKGADESNKHLRAHLKSFDGRFELSVESGPGGGWARLCGKRTGQRG